MARNDPRDLAGVHRGAHARNACGIVLYAVSIPLAFWRPWAAYAIYAAVALAYFVPERRIEFALRRSGEAHR